MALPSKNRIKLKSDFEAVFKRGRSFKGSFLLTKLLKSSFNYPRFGILLSSKIFPKSVSRNRIRRIISQKIVDSGIINSVSYDVLVRVLRKGKEEDILEDLNKAINMLKDG